MNNKEVVKLRILLCNLNLASYMNYYFEECKNKDKSNICKAALYMNALVLYDMGYNVYESDEEYYFIDYPESDFNYPKYRIKNKMIENLEKIKEYVNLELEKNIQIFKNQMLYLASNPDEDTGIAQFYNGAMVTLLNVKNKIKELED